ncbi:MAG: FAD-binding oxidoreductase [Planctomycetota bacterium]
MNIIRSQAADKSDACPVVRDPERLEREFADYLRDESRIVAPPVERIYLPETVAQVCNAVTACAADGVPLAISGARTGLTGGASPVGARAILSTEKFKSLGSVGWDAVKRQHYRAVGAGMTLADFQAERHQYSDGQTKIDLFYPIDPTETSAQIGGTIVNNASGARTFRYGATRDWVRAVTVVLANGEFVQLRRGDVIASDGMFVLESSTGNRTEIPLIDIVIPDTKSACGYPLRRDMDAVDLMIGSEGTLGVVIDAELRLAPLPKHRLYLNPYFRSEPDAVRFVKALRSKASIRKEKQQPGADQMEILAIEYMGPETMDFMRAKREADGASSHVPLLDPSYRASLFTDIAFETKDALMSAMPVIEAMLEDANASSREAWAGTMPADLVEMKHFRHAVPESVNNRVAELKRAQPSIYRIGTDMAVPDKHLDDVMALYRDTLTTAGVEFLAYGHIGDNHLHVAMIPHTPAELEKIIELYAVMAKAIVKMGGSASAEHGIGRSKRKYLKIQYDESVINAMKAVKAALDPKSLFNPGVLFM